MRLPARLGLLALIPPAYSLLTSPVERGLVRQFAGRPSMRNAFLPIGNRDAVSHDVPSEDFEACARRVPGWDLLIVLSS